VLTRALILTLLLAALARPICAQQQLTEKEALTAVNLATNPTTKLAAAEDFIARFPSSTSRVKIAGLVADEITKVRNGAVAVTLIERAQTIFTAKEEWELFKPIALQAFVKGERTDKAFALAREMLTANPDDVPLLTLMTSAGAEAARKRNRQYVDESLQYGLRAIALIEADKPPPNVDAATWSEHKKNLGTLYQQTAILYLAQSNTTEAKARLTRASTLQPNDPASFALLGRVLNAEYLEQMEAYESMPAGPAKQETLKRLDTLLDTIIDSYARAAGLATGRAEYQTLLQQVIPDLTNYYKYRHNQSIKGLRQLIDKYRLRP
jgi:tetratricopeptide (TPR) repeat protein